MNENVDPVGDMIASLVEANADALNSTTNQLLESYRTEAAEAQATLGLVREAMADLLNGQYMPTPRRILAAMWPNKKDIEERAQEWLQQ
jgi:hypothetical protein